MMAKAEKNFLIKKERPSAVGCFCPLRLLIGKNQKSQSCDSSEYKCADLQGVLGLGFPRLTLGWQRRRRGDGGLCFRRSQRELLAGGPHLDESLKMGAPGLDFQTWDSVDRRLARELESRYGVPKILSIQSGIRKFRCPLKGFSIYGKSPRPSSRAAGPAAHPPPPICHRKTGNPGAFRLRRRTAMQPKQPRFRGKNAKNAPKYAVFEAFFNVFGPDLPPLAERHFVANS
jgi:hypothetical protein